MKVLGMIIPRTTMEMVTKVMQENDKNKWVIDKIPMFFFCIGNRSVGFLSVILDLVFKV